MAVPSPSLSGDKIAFRRKAREQRRAYVARLSESERAKQEQSLAGHLAPLIATSRIIAAYSPMPDEISPLPALEQARQSATTIAFPAFSDHLSTLRFLAGEPTETGPFGVMQPPLGSTEVHPDLILVPLVAIDNAARVVRGAAAVPPLPAGGGVAPKADEPEALDLLALAGGSVYKRLIPLGVGAVVVAAVIVWFVARR